MGKPILYSYFRSSASWRVRVALAYKGIDFEMRNVHLVKSEQIGEEYLKLNPMGQVPAFVTSDGITLTQSLPILEYLEETHKDHALLPSDPVQRHKVREICEVINSGIQPLQNFSVIMKYSDDAVKRSEWVRFWIAKGLAALEQLLTGSSGTYCVGDQITLADCCLAPQVGAAERFEVDMSPYPLITSIHDRLKNLDAFKVAHPTAQPDCPEELKPKK